MIREDVRQSSVPKACMAKNPDAASWSPKQRSMDPAKKSAKGRQY